MQSREEGNIIIARLFSGEDLIPALKELCHKHNVETAIILSAIGQLKQFTLGYLNGKDYFWQEYSEVYELLSISGMVSKSSEENDYALHLHVTVADRRQQAFGGHLSQGVVENTNEIVLLKTPAKVKRKKDEKTGLAGLYLE